MNVVHRWDPNEGDEEEAVEQASKEEGGWWSDRSLVPFSSQQHRTTSDLACAIPPQRMKFIHNERPWRQVFHHHEEGGDSRAQGGAQFAVQGIWPLPFVFSTLGTLEFVWCRVVMWILCIPRLRFLCLTGGRDAIGMTSVFFIIGTSEGNECFWCSGAADVAGREWNAWLDYSKHWELTVVFSIRMGLPYQETWQEKSYVKMRAIILFLWVWNPRGCVV